MFPAGKKDASDAVEYDGGRNSDSIVAWALDKLAENVPPPDVVEVCVPSANCTLFKQTLCRWFVYVYVI